jgi:hypothetical protein
MNVVYFFSFLSIAFDRLMHTGAMGIWDIACDAGV